MAGRAAFIPGDRSTFVGRTAEIARLASLVDRHRLVSVVGPGGAGKTRLVAEAVRRHLRPRSVWVDVTDCSEQTHLVEVTLRELGERVGPSVDAIDVIARGIESAAALLVLDNCEHLVEVCAAFAESLLNRSPTLTVVATSREPLGVGAEAVMRIGSLDAAAVELFVDRAALAGRSIDLTGEADLVERVCDRVDRLPLALELAAARCGTMSLSDIVAGLERRFDLLAGGSRSGAIRHRSMRACLEWSTHLLSPVDRTVLERLSVFPSAWGMAQALAIVRDESIGEAAVAESIHSLTLRSLVSADVLAGRYRLLETVRDFAADALQRSSNAASWHDRHLDEVVRMADRAAAELEGPGADEAIASLGRAHADISAAISWAIETGRLDVAAGVVSALTLYWPASGRLEEAQRYLDRLLDERSSARQWWTQSYVAVYRGEIERAIGAAETAAALALTHDEPAVRARALDTGGFAAMYVDRTLALEQLADAVTLAEAHGDRWCAADAAQIMAFSRLAHGEHSIALSLLDRSRRAAVALDHAQLLAWDSAGRGAIELRSGRPSSALSHFDQARTQADRTGDPNITASVMAWGALAARALGQGAAQTSPLRDRLDHAIRIGAGQGTLELAYALAECAAQADEHDAVDAVWAQLGSGTRANAPASWPRLARSVALSYAGRGRLADAALLLAEAEQLAAGLHLDLDLGASLGAKAVLALLDGDPHGAERLASEAVVVLARSEVLTDVHDLALVLSGLELARGRRSDAEQMVFLAGGVPFGEATTPSPVATLLRSSGYGVDLPACASAAADPHAALGRWRRRRGRRRPLRFGWEAVTATEAEVARMAATGLSNRAIAEALHVAPGTVKSHLEHLYVKLGVANRTELAAFLNAAEGS